MATELLGATEIVGADELLGADDMVGAHVKGRLVRHNAERERQLVIGFDSVAALAINTPTNVLAQPQLLFRPERIVVPQAIAPAFVINDVRVGKDSQFLVGTLVPAECFSSTAFGVRMKMDTAQINSTISVNVTNIGAAALRFFAAMFGIAAQ